MRLLNVDTMEVELFVDENKIPPYTILSHCWGEQEVTLQDLQTGSHRGKHGFEKVAACCRRTKLERYRYTWIDTCCIDKSSSAELSEAINSMFRWYEEAQVCYAYLEDVHWDWQKDTWQSEQPLQLTRSAKSPFNSSLAAPIVTSFGARELGVQSPDSNIGRFAESRWFSRGWTLQELLAPEAVVFFDHHWQEIGTRTALAQLISAITGIDKAMLGSSPLLPGHLPVRSRLQRFPVATRMAWASMRQTTRPEDEAYCLFGLFDVNLPLIYGEGRRAFLRLQQEILRNQSDATILLWQEDDGSWPLVKDEAYPSARTPNRSMFASSPKLFARCLDFGLATFTTTHDNAVHAAAQAKDTILPTLQIGRDSATAVLKAPFLSLFHLKQRNEQGLDALTETHLAYSTRPALEEGAGPADDIDTIAADSASDQMRYYVAVLSQTSGGSSVGLLLEQLSTGLFVRPAVKRGVPQIFDNLSLADDVADVLERTVSKTLFLKAIAEPEPNANGLSSMVILHARVPASYEAPRVRRMHVKNWERYAIVAHEATVAVFRSTVPDRLPTFAAIAADMTGVVGCRTFPEDRPTAGEGPSDGALDRLFAQMETVTAMQETMRTALLPGQCDVVVSFRMERKVPSGFLSESVGMRIFVAVEPRPGSGYALRDDEVRKWEIKTRL